MNIFSKKQTEMEKGFTLMEVMVSVSIFAIIITVGIGSLLTIFGTLQKTRTDQQTMDSLSFVLDTMTRRIRTGFDYEGDASTITFKDQDYDGIINTTPVTYTVQANPLDNDALQLFATDVTGTFNITPDNLIINSFGIEITGTDPTDGIQPMVQIHLSGILKNGKRESPMSLQATVSQRILDFPISTGSIMKNPDTSTTSSFNKGTVDGSFRNVRTENPTDTAGATTTNSPTPTSPETSLGTIKALNPPR